MFTLSDFSIKEFVRLKDTYGNILIITPALYPKNQASMKNELINSLRVTDAVVFYDLTNPKVLESGTYRHLYYAKILKYEVRVVEENSVYIAVVTEGRGVVDKSLSKGEIEKLSPDDFVANIKKHFKPIKKETFISLVKPSESELINILQSELNIHIPAAKKTKETKKSTQLHGICTYNIVDNTHQVTLDKPPKWLDLDNGVTVRVCLSEELTAGAKIKLTNPEYYTNPNEPTGVWRNLCGTGWNRPLSEYAATPNVKRYHGNGFLEFAARTENATTRIKAQCNSLAAYDKNYQQRDYTIVMQTQDSLELSNLYVRPSYAANSPFNWDRYVPAKNQIVRLFYDHKTYPINPKGALVFQFLRDAKNNNIYYDGIRIRQMMLFGDATNLSLPADYWENDFGTWDIKAANGGAINGGEWKKGDVVELTLSVEGAFLNR